MTALEIIAMIVLCVIGLAIVMLLGQMIILIDKIENRFKNEKKPASENEADKGK